jgi:PAS domain S-box-containing protein
MKLTAFNFDEKEFNEIFPFYILIDANLKIIKTGKSLKKLIKQDISGQYFSDLFELDRPFTQDLDSTNFIKVINQLVLFKSLIINNLKFKGQFINNQNNYIFIGSPWFENIQKVVDNGLSFHDFSFHDPLMDLLHILKNQEINNSELKELLNTVNLQRKKIKEEKDNYEMLSIVASANKSGVIFVNEKGKIYWCNDAFCQLTGFNRDEVINQTPFSICRCKTSNKEDVKLMYNSFKMSQNFVIDISHNRKNENPFWARISGNPFPKYNNVTHFFAVINDITIEKEKTEKLNVLSSIAKNNINSVIICDKYGRIEWINDSFEQLTKYNLSEVKGKKSIKLLQGEETDKDLIAFMKAKIKKGESFNCEIINYKKNKEKYWVKIQGQAIKDKKNEVVKYFTIEEDITLQKNHTDFIIAQKEKYSSIITNMNMGLIEVDLDNVILFANQSCCDMLGYTSAELIGKKGTELVDSTNDIDKLDEKNELRLNGVSDSYEIIAKTKNGQLKNLIISGAPNYNFKGEITGSIGVHLDVTTQKKLEKQKEQLLNKLEKQNQRLNDYAQIVTHDLKSPLRSIHSLITWIKEDDKNVDPTTKEYLNLIESKVEKMDHLIQGIYTYSKVDEEDSITEDVNVFLILENLTTTLDIPEHIKIKINKDMPNLKANNFKIQQLFQNILTNAILYNDKTDGFIEIKYENKQINHLFSIYDNGPGIAEENKEKIFKVFQSFTNHYMSTGIGLSIVKRIVDNYKGIIWIESELTKGTTFFISLPIN